MFHRIPVRHLAVASALALLSACVENPLDVDNKNNPDVDRVYASPVNVETTVMQLFKNMYNGQYGASDAIWAQSLSMSFESHSQLGNFGMGTRAAIPRNPIDNSIGNAKAEGNFLTSSPDRHAKSAANTRSRQSMDSQATNRTIGGPARDARAKSFAYFALGYQWSLSLLYDSGAIISPTQHRMRLRRTRVTLRERGRTRSLGFCSCYANRPRLVVPASIASPADWDVPGTATISRADWIKLVRIVQGSLPRMVSRVQRLSAGHGVDAGTLTQRMVSRATSSCNQT